MDGQQDRYAELYGHVEGPSDEELRAAYQRNNERRRATLSAQTSGQGSLPRFIGTPRRAKHRNGRIAGVTIK